MCDSLPGPDGCRFIESENDNGESIQAGEWVERKDGLVSLRITRLPDRNQVTRKEAGCLTTTG